MTKDEALKMALEALSKIKYGLERNRVWGGMGWSYVPIHPTQYLPLRDKLEAQIAALRQALAEPERATLTPQEIYALSKQSGINFAVDSEGGWSGLTDDEISNRYTGKPHPEDEHAIKRTIEILKPFAKAIESRTLTNQKAKWYQEGVEAGLRQARAEPPNSTTDVVETEPFGWLFKQRDGELYKLLRGKDVDWSEKNNQYWVKVSPLYTEPPKREWAGLTDEEREDLWQSHIKPLWGDMKGISPTLFACKVEAKLKEKNT